MSFPDGRKIRFTQNLAEGPDIFWAGPGIPERVRTITAATGWGHPDGWALLLPDGGKVRFTVTPGMVGAYQTNFVHKLIGLSDPYGVATAITTSGLDTSVADTTGRRLQIVGRIITNSAEGTPGQSVIDRVEEWLSPTQIGRTVTYRYTAYGAGYPSLSSVEYFGDPTLTATYTYQASNNSAENSLPLIATCDDSMYPGPMSKIAYEFLPGSQGGAYGQIKSEKHHPSGTVVSTLEVTGANTRREKRGDGTGGNGPARTFTYSSSGYLTSWTDFLNQTSSQTHLNGFVNSFTDARGQSASGYTTNFVRGARTGNVEQITHPATPSDSPGVRPVASRSYVASCDPNTGDPNNCDPSNPYYLHRTTDERNFPAVYLRNSAKRVERINYPGDYVGLTPAKAFETFAYDAKGRVEVHRRTNGNYDHFQYDARGLLLYAWNPVASASRPTGPEPKTSLTYYPLGHVWQDRVQTVTDPRGKQTTYEYDRLANGTAYSGRGLVTRIIVPGNKTRTFVYDRVGNVTRQENELGQPMEYVYDDYRRVTDVKMPRPLASNPTIQDGWNVLHYDYTPASGVSPYARTANAPTTITTATALKTTIEYDANLRVWKSTQVDMLGEGNDATTESHYDAVGNQDWIKDPKLQQTTFEYDQRNRRKKAISPPVPLAGVTGNVALATEWFYDPVGNVRAIIQPDDAPPSTLRRQYFTHDEMNRVLTATDPMGRVTSNKYYASGQLRSVKDPKQQGTVFETAFEYNERDLRTKLIYPNNQQVTGWIYDENGNMTQRPTVGGPKQLFGYDDRNRLATMRWDNGIDFSDFGYDDAGRLASARNPFSTVTRTYDVAGRMTLDRQKLQANPDPVLPANIVPTSVVSRRNHAGVEYDIALPLTGEPGIESRAAGTGGAYQMVLTFATPVTVPLAQVRVSTGIGRVLSVVPVGSQLLVNLDQVSNAQRLTVTFSGLSNGATTGDLVVPMRVLVGDVTHDLTINASDKSQVKVNVGMPVTPDNFLSDVNCNGAITTSDTAQVTAGIGSGLPAGALANYTADISYEYDADGKRTRHQAASNDYFFYAYDGLGRVKRIYRWDHNLTYDYDLNSNVVARRDPLPFRNTTLEFPRDALNRPSGRMIRLPVPAQPQNQMVAANDVYEYDAMSRLTSTERVSDGNKRDAFGYNAAGELIQADYDQQLSGGVWTGAVRSVRYLLDGAGNRDGVIDSTQFTPDLLNQYEQTTNGSQHEVAAYDQVSYGYLADGQLAQASSAAGGVVQYGYDALGRRVRSTVGTSQTQTTTWFAYDGAHPILEFDSGGNVIARSFYGAGLDELIARDNYGTAQYYHQDRLGSVTMVTNNSGGIEEHVRYDAFGAPTFKSPSGTPLPGGSAINNRFLFAGREWIKRFGFYENRARAYNPKLGRFMTEDPLGFAAGDTNLFRYCGGDPVNHTDPSGLTTSWFKKFSEAIASFLGSNTPGTATTERITITGSAVPDAVAGLTSQGGAAAGWTTLTGTNGGLSALSQGGGAGQGFSITTGVRPMPFLGNPTIGQPLPPSPSSSQPGMPPSRPTDFYQATVALPIPYPPAAWAGAQVSVAVTLEPLRVFVGVGPSVGLPVNGGWTATANGLSTLATQGPPSAAAVGSVLTGSAFTGSAAWIGAATTSWSPSGGLSWSAVTVGGGAGYRGVSVGYTYSWQVYGGK